jgi:hypothetical protein
MSINPNKSTANIKLFELCEPPQREVKHPAKTAKPEIRGTAMLTKISAPTVEAVIQTDRSKKRYGAPEAGDDRRGEPSKGALAKMTEAHVTSLDAIVHGFANARALHF